MEPTPTAPGDDLISTSQAAGLLERVDALFRGRESVRDGTGPHTPGL